MPLPYLAAAVAIACFGGGSPSPLPDGWVYLEEEGIDSVRGAYHDSVSDLLVRIEADYWGESVEPWSIVAARQEGSTISVQPKGRYVVTEVVTRRGATCVDLVLSLRCDSVSTASWNLSAYVCSADERSRLDALVLSLVRSDGPRFTVEKPFEPSQLATLKGAHWREVSRRLGRGGLVERPIDGGFSVSYAHGSLRARLYFGRDQRLYRWTIWSNARS